MSLISDLFIYMNKISKWDADFRSFPSSLCSATSAVLAPPSSALLSSGPAFFRRGKLASSGRVHLLYLHFSRCPPAFRCCAWHAFPQYTTALHREHGFRAALLAISATPQLAQV